MFRVMATKELQETRGIALLGLAIYGYVITCFVSPLQSPWIRFNHVPFVSDDFGHATAFLFAIMAIALGLRQTLGESVRGTYPFLLHRPASLRWLIGTKLFVGLVVYLICSAMPIVVCGLVAARPGTHASPFAWSMTVPAWEVWFRMTLLYLGAFLTGIRPGRWSRSRLLPLAGAAIAYIFVAYSNATFWGPLLFRSGESLRPCLIVGVVDAWLIAMILFVARTRDYS